MAERAGVNPYRVTQVNIREQCSWTHTDDPDGATRKAIRLVSAGIARAQRGQALEPIAVETTPRVAVIGGGVAGMRAAIGLADIGLGVYLIEREPALGGWVGGLGEMFPRRVNGRALVERMRDEIARRPAISVYTNAEVVAKSGSYGNYQVVIRAGDDRTEITVGQIIVATGFDIYEPEAGEFGYGSPGVVTLAEFRQLLDEADGPIVRDGKPDLQHRLHLLRRQPRRRTGSTARAIAAAPPSTHRCSSPTAIRPSASTTSTATCGPTDGTR